MKGTDFLIGALWGSGAAKKDIDSAKRNESAAKLQIQSLDREADNLSNIMQHYRRDVYVETTKLKARVATEKALLNQLEENGLANDSRIPLANIEKFDDAYLINLLKARQEQSVIDYVYPNGMPDDVETEMKDLNIEISQELREKGYKKQDYEFK